MNNCGVIMIKPKAYTAPVRELSILWREREIREEEEEETKE
jgi:hypothetical protein